MAYMGFNKVEGDIEKQGKSPKQASAIAAAIGRRKLGSKKMAQLAAQGRKRAASKG